MWMQLTGLPAVLMQVGLDSHGLPLCIQLILRRWDDERLVVIARLILQVAGEFRKLPGY
jgi:Asp-tRNA(Asn)/Glu-tRNA(Gln) amidotransferase A subunit family amidase